MEKIVTMLLAAALVCGLTAPSALAAYTDTQGHWAEETITKWEYLRQG